MNDPSIKRFEAANRARWEELVPIHVQSNFYNLDDFRQGAEVLWPIELEEVGDVAGKSMLHLQCHFGMGTIAWARRGASATGVDFSIEAIEQARKLSSETGVNANFICANVYELETAINQTFDIVFCSYGVLCWLYDLMAWAKQLSYALSKGGFFYLVDEHPIANCLQGRSSIDSLRVARSYFSSTQPAEEVVIGTYADRKASVSNNKAYLWNHNLGDIVNALIENGLSIEFVHEFPFSVYERYEGMVSSGWGQWRLPDDDGRIPYLFSIKARK
jgi:SAM-dependent methyltransferase